jgi:hypothetical protein
VKFSQLTIWCAVLATTTAAARPAPGQTAIDPYAIPYPGPPPWQQAAVAALNRHLPADSGYWVLGPLDLTADTPDTTDLVRTTLRIIAPDPRAARLLSRRLWVPTGGVALEDLQPADTLPHQLPPGYPGRFLKGTIVGEPVWVQVFTVQTHRWLLWAQRAEVAGITERVAGPVATYRRAVSRHLAAVDSGRPTPGPPSAERYGLEPMFDLYAAPPEPVIRERAGYLDLLARNRAFDLDGQVRGVEGFIPGPRLMGWLEEQAEGVLFASKEGEPALQHRYRDFLESGGRWSGYPLLDATTLPRLAPGRYVYVVDRYGFIRVAPVGSGPEGPGAMTAAMLAHGDPVRVAGELRIEARPEGPRVAELNVRSEEYFFSNRSLTLYADVEERAERYLVALGHALRALDLARIPREGILLRKF